MCVIDRPETTGNTTAAQTIRTARLTLRPAAEKDVAAITRFAGDYAIASMTTRMPHPYREADARQFVDVLARQDGARERTFMIAWASALSPSASRLELGSSSTTRNGSR